MRGEPLPKKATKANRGGAFLEFYAPTKKLAKFPVVFGLCIGSFCLAVILKRSYFRNIESEEIQGRNHQRFLQGEEEFRKAKEDPEINKGRIKIQ